MRAAGWPLLAAFAIMGTAVSAAGAGTAIDSTLATPAPASTKDPCGATKSKWAHFQCMQFNSSAAGDEYFGYLKLSYLGIHNIFKDGAISAGTYTTDSRLISRLMSADDALHAWEKKYPNDPELARSYFLGEQVWRKVYTQDGQRMAWQYIQTLTHTYSGTYFGKTIAASLAKNGFTQHWYAVPQLCSAPRPTPTPTAAPGDPPSVVIVPPCLKSLPSPSPSPKPKSSKHP